MDLDVNTKIISGLNYYLLGFLQEPSGRWVAGSMRNPVSGSM
jgi:hypothetical protein